MIVYRKRYLKTPGEFFQLMKKSTGYSKKIKKIDEKNKIAPSFAEKIMLAVTGVNECLFCSYRHAKSALEKGVELKEIQDLLKSEFSGFSEEEQVALLYAQHWADNGGKADEDARKRMVDYYGEQKTGYIEFYMHMVYMGNLVSNTVEAFKNRVVPDTGKAKFFFTYLLCAPIAAFIKKGTTKEQEILENPR
ncbi:MAG: carboxymuconolactone decarboxylase family protein [Spirochaetales bacterium]|nr:carboxymuconolactone decarboxylase family protein [Spirochaetales bacterium]